MKPIFNAQSVRELQNRPKHERLIEEAAQCGKRKTTLSYEFRLVALEVQTRLRNLGFKVGNLQSKDGFYFDVSW